MEWLRQECFNSLIWDVNYTDVKCLRLGLSKGLGLGIVVFGSIIKFPQIYKIVSARSATGISLAMYILEVIAYTISLVYAIRLRIPFSTYGENASLTVQSTSRGLPRHGHYAAHHCILADGLVLASRHDLLPRAAHLDHCLLYTSDAADE